MQKWSGDSVLWAVLTDSLNAVECLSILSSHTNTNINSQFPFPTKKQCETKTELKSSGYHFLPVLLLTLLGVSALMQAEQFHLIYI